MKGSNYLIQSSKSFCFNKHLKIEHEMKLLRKMCFAVHLVCFFSVQPTVRKVDCMTS